MKKVIHSGRGKRTIWHLIQDETYTMSDVRTGLTFLETARMLPKPGGIFSLRSVDRRSVRNGIRVEKNPERTNSTLSIPIFNSVLKIN